MPVIKEHYRDFLGTINTKRAEINSEIESSEDYFECSELNHELDFLTNAQEYFMNSTRWVYFETLDLLKLYVQNLENAYKNIDNYSKSVLPVDGGNLIGITQNEWEELEVCRYDLRKKSEAWTLFADFCEYGKI